MKNYFSPKGSRFGIAPAFVGRVVTAALTATGTDTLFIPRPNRLSRILGLSVSTDTVPVNAAANTAIFYKYDASADAAIALCAATDLETLVTKEGRTVALLSTLTDAQLMLDDGDTLYVVTTQGGAQTTQPTNLYFAVELAVLE